MTKKKRKKRSSMYNINIGITQATSSKYTNRDSIFSIGHRVLQFIWIEFTMSQWEKSWVAVLTDLFNYYIVVLFKGNKYNITRMIRPLKFPFE